MKFLKNFFKIILVMIVISLASSLLARIPTGRRMQTKGHDDTYELSGITDDAGLFDDKQFSQLEKEIKDTARAQEINIHVYVSGTARSDYATEEFANGTYDEMFGDDTDGVFLYLDFSGQFSAYDLLSCSGSSNVVHGPHIDEILDSVGLYLPASGETVYPDNVMLAIEEFCRQIEYYSKEYSGNVFEYTYDGSTGKYFYKQGGKFYCSYSKPPGLRRRIANAGCFVGFIAAILIYFIAKSRYRFKSKTNPMIYVVEGKTHFNEESDTFIRSYVTKHKIESSSSGGGSSRGGGGSHSSGGGGHVSGGRHR